MPHSRYICPLYRCFWHKTLSPKIVTLQVDGKITPDFLCKFMLTFRVFVDHFCWETAVVFRFHILRKNIQIWIRQRRYKTCLLYIMTQCFTQLWPVSVYIDPTKYRTIPPLDRLFCCSIFVAASFVLCASGCGTSSWVTGALAGGVLFSDALLVLYSEEVFYKVMQGRAESQEAEWRSLS